ncbi:unnamed protein product [Rhizoctonia solani]|uniref:Uncharacterized protein n=1 Tax=Rhizoctonia solani TaxID=456999 RepID=A0A8H3C3P2_9AGAM|nr:unnamed protein product [Rhizoctonia solani]
MESVRVFRSGETLISPPHLPTYLSDTYDLKPIVGKPADEDVKVIHAVIRSLNAMAHVPALYNPDLSMRLSQHLFGAQMAVYRADYSISLLPGEKSVYTPPKLPWHITDTLNQVVGAPSDEEVKSVQSAVRAVEDQANNPKLFDANLNMNLSQHLFNLQFARYMHDSGQGSFTSEDEIVPRSMPHSTEGANDCLNNTDAPKPENSSHAPSEIVQLGETAKEIKSILLETKDVLGNMNQVLRLTRASSTIGTFGDKVSNVSVIHSDPVNQHGMLATECGLPLLRYWLRFSGAPSHYALWLGDGDLAGYLRFFDIGSDLIAPESAEKPKLIGGKVDEATSLLLKHVGLGY